MLFQGEEWNASTPFLYFTSFRDQALAAAVRKGRREEFAQFHSTEEVPDPQDAHTFARSKLDWSERDANPHRDMLDWYKSLIKLRRELKDLVDPRRDRLAVEYDESSQWLLMQRGDCLVTFNFASERRTIYLPQNGTNTDVVLSSKPEVHFTGKSIELPARTVAILARRDR